MKSCRRWKRNCGKATGTTSLSAASLADAGKGTVAKQAALPLDDEVRLADAGKGTVAKPDYLYPFLCEVLPTLEKELWQSP